MKKRISALMLSVVLCLAMLSTAALGTANPNVTFTPVTTSDTAVAISGTGFTPNTEYKMCSVMQGDVLLALFNVKAAADGKISKTVTTGALAQGSLTVSIIDGTGATVASGNGTVGPPSVTPPDPGPGPGPTPPGGDTSTGGGGGGGGGSVNQPSVSYNKDEGTVTISSNGKNVTIKPAPGYRVKDVIINGESVGAVVRYTFDKASGDNTVEVIFEKIEVTAPSLRDVSGHWAASAIAFVTERGLFNGTSATEFSPNAPMTRAMLVTVLHRLAGTPASGQNTFADVPPGQWYTDAVAWANASGIVTGTGAGSFSPNGNVTREQLATMLYRYVSAAEGDTSATGALTRFSDGGSVSSWAADAMAWAVGAGILGGRDTGALDPAGNATRAEVATMLMRLVDFLD